LKFDDITLIPAPISYIRSRKDVDTNISLCGEILSVPLISSNMTSVYSTKQAHIIQEFGAKAVVHRFCSIEENVKLLNDGKWNDQVPWVSCGVNDYEFERAKALIAAGAKVLLVEVANAAHISCIEQYKRLRETFKDIKLVVGTFATGEQVKAFCDIAGSVPDAVLAGVGTGAACTTGSDVTGIHIPAVITLRSVVQTGIPTILSGGISKPSDMMIALAIGAQAMMCGKIFSACYESGAKGFSKDGEQYFKDYSERPLFKWYYGSASQDAYEEQQKTATHRPVEGKGMMVKCSGSTEDLLLYYQSSLRSMLTYLNCQNMEDFRKNVHWSAKH